MSSKALVLALAALSLFSLARAEVAVNSKPAISPAIDFEGAVEAGLRENLSPTPSTHNVWVPGWIPEFCKREAQNFGYSPFDIEVFHVHYSDCSAPWTMCRHKDAKTKQADMIDLFGRMPLGMREFTSHIIALPRVSKGAAALSIGDSIAISDGCMLLSILAHEMSHSLDHNALLNLAPAPFSTSSRWKDKYNLDQAAVSEYARTSWVEDFAETGIVALYDTVVPGGIRAIQKNCIQIFSQYSTFQHWLGNIIIPHSKPQCTRRLNNSRVVPMGDSAKFRIREGAPDVSIGAGIEIIPDGIHGNVTFVTPAREN